MGITWHYMELKFISIGEGFIMLLTTGMFSKSCLMGLPEFITKRPKTATR